MIRILGKRGSGKTNAVARIVSEDLFAFLVVHDRPTAREISRIWNVDSNRVVSLGELERLRGRFGFVYLDEIDPKTVEVPAGLILAGYTETEHT